MKEKTKKTQQTNRQTTEKIEFSFDRRVNANLKRKYIFFSFHARIVDDHLKHIYKCSSQKTSQLFSTRFEIDL